MALFAALSALMAACTGGTPETPGDQPNAVLAQVLQKALDDEIARLDPSWSPGLLPAAPALAREWLTQIDEVVARCRYGPRSQSKHNLLEFDLRLHSGETIEALYTGQRCTYGIAPPLIMRVRMRDGRVAEALTDGRERRRPVDAVAPEAHAFATAVITADLRRRAARYFVPSASPQDIQRQWDAGARP
ncbi:hypothetical protein [Pseudacidovorax sp. RU35E]|uniref:hypothetical protein n=1 Tax=Pseudacidovorax sp. RU35E TaxID=1907403 RepID=UPI000955A1B7|nr:hypothetical protein [Pseudacidovorax sp. RU35E]SIR54966.1 hypothetical protein SAMN05880557_11324 [Pseudacidovorax sp. RU35E]